MADRYLLESGAPDGYQLEDGSGVLLLEPPVVAFDAVSSGNGTGATVTVSHTCTGSNRVLIVDAALGINPDTRTLTATYNGVSMTSLGLRHSNDQSSGYIEKFILINPDSGTHDIVVTRSGTGTPTLIVGGMSFNGASQTLADYTGNFFSAAGDGINPSVAVTGTAASSIIQDGACNGSAFSAVGSGQTQRWNLNVDFNSAAGNAAGSTEPGNGGTVTMSWDVSTDWWAIQAVEILTVTEGGPENVDLAASALTLTPQALDPVPGVVNVDLAASTLTFTAQALDPVPVPINVDLVAGALTFAAQPLDPVPGPVNLDLSPATLTLAAQPLSPVSGVVNIDLAAATLTFTAQALDPALPPLEVDLAAGVLTFTAQALSPVSGVANVDLSPATLALVAQALDPVSGTAQVDLANATLTFAAQPLTPVSGIVNVDLVPATLTFGAQPLDPVEASGVVNVDLAPATLIFTAQALDPVSGTVNINLVPASLVLVAQPLDPVEPAPATYRFFPPVIIEKPIGLENKLLLKTPHSRGLALRLVNGLYVEAAMLVYERDVLNKMDGVDYFVGGHRYTGLSPAIAALLIASGYTPEVE